MDRLGLARIIQIASTMPMISVGTKKLVDCDQLPMYVRNHQAIPGESFNDEIRVVANREDINTMANSDLTF